MSSAGRAQWRPLGRRFAGQSIHLHLPLARLSFSVTSLSLFFLLLPQEVLSATSVLAGETSPQQPPSGSDQGALACRAGSSWTLSWMSTCPPPGAGWTRTWTNTCRCPRAGWTPSWTSTCRWRGRATSASSKGEVAWRGRGYLCCVFLRVQLEQEGVEVFCRVAADCLYVCSPAL